MNHAIVFWALAGAAALWTGAGALEVRRLAAARGAPGTGTPVAHLEGVGVPGGGVGADAATLPRGLENSVRGLLVAGVAVLAALLAALWLSLDRPPLRTLGETRLWYAALLPLIGLAIEWRLGTRALRLPMIAFGLLFIAINLARPDALDRTLMPALRSPWFVPHVVVYMVSYAALGLACGAALGGWIRAWRAGRAPVESDAALARLLVRLAIPFLTLGLAFGALWAKEAWGHYWTWDPKETWAFLTWAAYLCLLHVDRERGLTPRQALLGIGAAFVVVLGCWFLVNELPSAQASVHTYTRD